MAKRSEVDKKLWPYRSEKGELPESADFERIGARFRHGRHQRGISQRRLADEAGISQSVVSRFERGLVRKMSAERIVRLAIALGPELPVRLLSARS